MIVLLPLLAWAGSPALTLDGACPGPVTVSVADLAPGALVAFLSGARGGAERIPAGGCAGVFTELAGLSLVAALRDADGDGVVSVTPELGAELCGVSLQAVDLSTCATTRPATLLGGDGCSPSGSRADFDTLESSTVTGCYTGDPCDHDDLLLWPADSAVFAEWGEALTCAALARIRTAPGGDAHVGDAGGGRARGQHRPVVHRQRHAERLPGGLPGPVVHRGPARGRAVAVPGAGRLL